MHTAAGVIYRRHGRHEQAESHWRRAGLLDPRLAVCRRELALLCSSQNRIPEAIRLYEQLIELDPQSVIDHVNLGLLHARSRHPEAAEQCYRKAQQIAPEDSVGYRELARLFLVNRREYGQSKRLAEKAVQLEPGNVHYREQRQRFVRALRAAAVSDDGS